VKIQDPAGHFVSGARHRLTPGQRPSYLFAPIVSLALLLMSTVGFTLTYFGAPLPQESWNERIIETSAAYQGLPSPTMPLRDFLCSLRTPFEFSRFLKVHSKCLRCPDPFTYATEFRMGLDEFQEHGWKGDCNDFANVICEVGYRHGYPMGIISMWPLRVQDRLSKDWHQTAVLCLQENSDYLIFEFEQVFRWRGTLQEYARYHEKEIIPFGGVIDWRPTKKNPLARFMDHLRGNVRLEENSRPLRIPEPRSMT